MKTTPTYTRRQYKFNVMDETLMLWIPIGLSYMAYQKSRRLDTHGVIPIGSYKT